MDSWLTRARVVAEDETLGEAYPSELSDPLVDDAFKTRRLRVIVERIEAAQQERWILERFHLTYAALMPTWSGFDEIDERMAALGFCQVLLVVPEEELPRRSFAREDFGPEWSEGMIALHGSVEKSIAALADSQRRRVQALKRSRLPSLTIDTSSRDWNAIAQKIAAFAQ